MDNIPCPVEGILDDVVAKQVQNWTHEMLLSPEEYGGAVQTIDERGVTWIQLWPGIQTSTANSLCHYCAETFFDLQKLHKVVWVCSSSERKMVHFV